VNNGDAQTPQQQLIATAVEIADQHLKQQKLHEFN
jgi:hypothetical protein